MTQELALFRKEVSQARADRLHGSINLATPFSWQLIGFLLLAAVVIAAIFLSRASYARVQTVLGVVTLDRGIATIIPSRAGVVVALEVSEGARVRAGQVLARIRSEEDLVGGDTAPMRVREALREQDQRLRARGVLLMAAADADKARLREQVIGISGELESLATQIADQRRLVAMAVADYDGAERVAANGFISRRDLDSRQATILLRKQQLAQLEQLRASKIASIAEAKRTITQSRAAAEAQLAGAHSDRAALAQQVAQADLARGYAITAPVAGVVTALTARLGQPANGEQQLMMVIPAQAKPRVELYVPSAAIGFVRTGQEVRLAIDAFPYQQFGTLPGRVAEVSAATITKQGQAGPSPVYLVTASLPQPWIAAFGRRQPLVPGMTLTARVVTENRTLLEWLLEPLFAVGNR